MAFIDKIRILEERYREENVRQEPTGGDVIIYFPDSEGSQTLSPHRLTWQQAAYLADHPISNDDMRQGRFPADWPARRT
jgi:hypothetical protein